MDEKTIIPDALTFDFIPACKKCNKLDLTMNSWDLVAYGNSSTSMKSHVLSCSHLESCKTIMKYCHNHK